MTVAQSGGEDWGFSLRDIQTKEGIVNMGFGFVLTIVLLGVVLGLVARQALATAETDAAEATPGMDQETDSSSPHSHAM
jgi:hypothetical protein